MDKSWMTSQRNTNEYLTGVTKFLEHCKSFCSDLNRIICPCVKCGNFKKVDVQTLEDHLIINGIDRSYRVWIYHGEKKVSVDDGILKPNDFTDAPFISQMVDDVQDELMDNPDEFASLLVDAEKPLYPGCKKYTKLSILVRLFNLKAKHGVTDSFYNELLDVVKDMLPDENEMVPSLHMAKKTLGTMGLGYEKIHACPNDCILYRNELEDASECPICNESRWKKKKNSSEVFNNIPAKVLWYIPIIPRFVRMFRNAEHAKNLTWHENGRIKDNKMRHPADSPQWKHVDSMWPEFGNEPRNLRLGLSADGINPHSSLSSRYSCWPVILVNYNLPPSLCFKRKFMHLALLIPGPKQPGNDIDVYLAPLIDDLKLLWEIGVKAIDGSSGKAFTLHAALMWTINDFPAYGNLSGCTVKGYKGCPICEEDTVSERLKHSKKIVYMGHRRFLRRDHPFRRFKKVFNGKQEFGTARSEPLSGVEVEQKLSRTMFKPLGKKLKKTSCVGSSGKRKKSNLKELSDDGCWKKRSIFFELEYWKYLLVRHTLDVMHIEKNVCESIVGTLLNIAGKSKDGVASRNDLEDLGIRSELVAKVEGNRTYLPPACYTLTRDEKRKFCKALSDIKVPEGFSSNIRNYVSTDELKLFGLKSHDCHILMQHFLPVAIDSIMPEGVRNAIIRLCLFFNALCCKVIDVSKLDSLQDEIVVTLCLLEQYFMPSFFDVMVHLTVHLVREVKLCGPVFMHWMYPFERFMKVVKGYVKNRFRPEGCIVEKYVAEECLEFCSEYLRDLHAIGIPNTDDQDLSVPRGVTNGIVSTISLEQLLKAHRNVLQNTDVVQPYIDEHLNLLQQTHKNRRQKWIQDEHHRSFTGWFHNRISVDLKTDKNSVCSTLRSVYRLPTLQVFKHMGYIVNGCRFTTKERDNARTTQNSGVSLVAKTMQFSSAKDNRPIYSDMVYYGVIKEIWELDYISIRVPIFLCDWVESNNGIRVGKNGITMVELNRTGHKEEPFILATQASQVFYVPSPSDDKWFYVFKNEVKDVDSEVYYENITSTTGSSSDSSFEIINESDQCYLRSNVEGIWVDNNKNR